MDRGAWWAAVHGVAKSQTRLSDFTFTHWRRKWQPTPLFLPGESHGQRRLVGYKSLGSQRVGHDLATNTWVTCRVIRNVGSGDRHTNPVSPLRTKVVLGQWFNLFMLLHSCLYNNSSLVCVLLNVFIGLAILSLNLDIETWLRNRFYWEKKH